MQMKGDFHHYQKGGLVNQSKSKYALCQNFCQLAKLTYKAFSTNYILKGRDKQTRHKVSLFWL